MSELNESLEEGIDPYQRGCEVTTAAINKFGYDFAETALLMNHPKKLKGFFSSQAKRKYTQGCFDTLKARQPK